MGFKLKLGSKEKNTGSSFRMDSPLKVMFPGSVAEGENMKSPVMKREEGEKSKVGKFLGKVGKAADKVAKKAGETAKKAKDKAQDTWRGATHLKDDIDHEGTNKGDTSSEYVKTTRGMDEIEAHRASRKATRKEVKAADKRKRAAELDKKSGGHNSAKAARLRARATRKEKNAKYIRKHGRLGHQLRAMDYEATAEASAPKSSTTKTTESSTKGKKNPKLISGKAKKVAPKRAGAKKVSTGNITGSTAGLKARAKKTTGGRTKAKTASAIKPKRTAPKVRTLKQIRAEREARNAKYSRRRTPTRTRRQPRKARTSRR